MDDEYRSQNRENSTRQETTERCASAVHDDDDTYEGVFGHSGHKGCAMLDKNLDGTTRAHRGSSDQSHRDVSAINRRSDDGQDPIK